MADLGTLPTLSVALSFATPAVHVAGSITAFPLSFKWVEGVVEQSNLGMAARVLIFKSDTGEKMQKTVSDNSGFFRVALPDNVNFYAVPVSL